MAGLPTRLEVARDLVLGRAAGRVLELGGGGGVLAASLMDRVEEYVGVDRSGHAVDTTRARLAGLETTTRWSLHRGTLETLGRPGRDIDVAEAVNVNVFWTTPAARELGRIAELLTSAGCLVLVYETPAGVVERLLDPLTRSLSSAAYTFTASRVHDRLAITAAPERGRR